MKSKQNNPILLYCNNVRERITEFFANSSYMGIAPTPQQIIDFVKRGFAIKQYMLYELFDDFLRIEKSKIGHEIQDSTYYKYYLVVERFKQAVPNLISDRYHSTSPYYLL